MDIYDKCLIRYIVSGIQGDREVTGVIIEEHDLLKVYWPHLGRIQPDTEEMEFGETFDYTDKGWITDKNLVSCHPPVKTQEDIEMWVMLHPEDFEAIHTLRNEGWI